MSVDDYGLALETQRKLEEARVRNNLFWYYALKDARGGEGVPFSGDATPQFKEEQDIGYMRYGKGRHKHTKRG